MDSTIILIGPMSAGKSTVAPLLAERLGLPRYELDGDRWTYYEEIGYDHAKAGDIARNEGRAALVRYWKPFEAHAVERTLADHSGSVIDFGAGHSVYDDEALFQRVAAALAPFPYVVLLVPSADVEESVAQLNARLAAELEEEDANYDRGILDINAGFVRHPSNYRLAKIIVYTDGQTPEQTVDAIVARVTQA